MRTKTFRTSKWWHFLVSLVATIMMVSPLAEALADAVGILPVADAPGPVIQEAFWGWLAYIAGAAIVIWIDGCRRGAWMC